MMLYSVISLHNVKTELTGMLSIESMGRTGMLSIESMGITGMLSLESMGEQVCFLWKVQGNNSYYVKVSYF